MFRETLFLPKIFGNKIRPVYMKSILKKKIGTLQDEDLQRSNKADNMLKCQHLQTVASLVVRCISLFVNLWPQF